jgi:hypothetical protein
MRSVWNRFWNDDRGIVVSAELVLVLTVAVLGVLVGLAECRTAIVAEFGDLSAAFGHLNQSYGFAGLHGCWNPCGGGWRSWIAGSSFVDGYEAAGVGLIGDIGCIPGPAYGGFSRGYSGCTRFGTIVLSDGTLIPLRMVGAGTWELPGGMLLAEFSSRRGYLSLSDGTSIPFLYGLCGIVEFADETVLTARPGARGKVVLSDERIAAWSADEVGNVVLEDGTQIPFYAAEWDHVILANATSMALTSTAEDALVLADGRVLHLRDAILPPGAEQVFDGGAGFVPPGFLGPGCCDVPLAPLPPMVAPIAPCCPTPFAPEAVVEPGCGGKCKTKGRLPIEIPAGPIPQRLPQG